MSSSWLLPRSVANSLTAYPAVSEFPLKESEMVHQTSNNSSPESGRGVKEDLSEIKNSIAQKLRGVASFLKPLNDGEHEGMRKIDGIRSDFAEIGGKVKAGISKIIQAFPDDGGDYQATRPVGVTDELLAFVRDLVTHPRTWVRFPLPDEANADGFALNDAQQLHVGAVERNVPELGDLRWELCPEYLSEGRFWMIYFVLVHPKLDKYDALTLSSPQIVEARASMTQESKNRKKFSDQPERSLMSSDDHDVILQSSMEEHSNKDISNDASTPNINNQAPKERSSTSNVRKSRHLKAISNGSMEEDDSDDWLNDETLKEVKISNEEEVSFSDLEEDEDTKGNK